jgi:hydroxyacylglutathione hydrolase
MIIEMLTVGPFQENCYLIGDEATKTGAIIDPGDEAERILKAAKKTGLNFQFILNTHAHLDHVCAVQAVKDALGIPFYLHKDDLVLLENLPKQAAMFGMRVDHVPQVDMFFNPGTAIRIGHCLAAVHHTPGHSPGSVSFYFLNEKVVFGGDVLFNGSIGRTDLFGGDFDTLIHSIQEKLFTLPDEVTVYPGHGPETSIGFEKQYNPFFQGGSGLHFA